MKHCILVVEDCRTVRDGLVEAFDREGFVGIPAATGREALDYLEAGGRASVIVLDALMPDMDGWTFRRAQERNPRFDAIPVVAVSALQGRPIRGLRPHASFQKPVDLARLISTVHALCGTGQTIDAPYVRSADL